MGKNKGKMRNMLLLFVILGVLFASSQVFAAKQETQPVAHVVETEKNGWVQENNNWYYYDKGIPQKDWISVSNTWYYLKEDGAMATNWQHIRGVWYYLRENGAMATDWLQEGNTWYYLRENGAMATDWQKIRGTWYYLQGNGAMVKGWLRQGNTWYYLRENGYMAIGWEKVGDTWYYLQDNGYMVTGWLQVGSTWYYLRGNGAMAIGWEKVGDTWYYLRDNGSMVTGWQPVGSLWYYMDASGAMRANQWIGSYYVNASGAWEPNKVMNKKIAIDPGHQRKGDSSKEPIGPGASTTKPKVASGTSGVVSGLDEYELTLTVSLKLRDELKARGYEIYMIRETHDVNISNSQRAKNAAAEGSDILVRIHANGDDNSSVYGALTMAPSSQNPYLGSMIGKSQTLSQKVIDHLCQVTGAKNRGVMTTDTMSGINWSTIPVTIVEMGFMSNPNEDRKMATDSYQNQIVQGIANGIDDYYK